MISTLLITGGTGSFGNAVLRGALDRSRFSQVRILSRDEKKQDDMRRLYGAEGVEFFIGDVRDPTSVDAVMRGVDYVFHAAALKQVPSCEFFPIEAVRTNVIGASNVLNAAVRHGVKKAVVLSTDKAVYPINAMGMSKALMEKTMVAASRQSEETVLCGTRYGNVMASRGSVIPLFIRQALAGDDLTITDPEMTRFMMTLEDAVDLVMFAFDQGKPGDMFVQKSPAATIQTLADAIIELLDSSSKTRVIGTRHGEKLYESLVNREEMVKAIDMGDYFRIPADTRDLNYGAFFDEGDRHVAEVDEYHSHNTTRLDVAGTKELLLKLPMIHAAIESRAVPA